MKSLQLQVMLEAIDKASAPLRKIMAGSNEAAKALKASKQALKELEKTQENIKGFVSLKKELGDTSRRLDETQKKIREIARTQKTEGYESKTYEATLRKLKEEAKSLTAAKSKQQQQLQQMRGTLEAAGIKTRHLAEHEKRLRADITATNAAIDQQKKQLDELGKAHARMKAYRDFGSKMHRGGMVAMGHGAALMYGAQRTTMAALAPAREAIGFESAMADVRKVVDFDTPEQFQQMQRDIRALSMELPMAASEIAQIIAAAGQAGIARDELRQFARDAVQMGVAFDTTAEASGQTMATWRTAFRMDQTEVVELADRINYLGNTGPASVHKISEVVNRIGALGEVAGLQSGPLAALGATVAGMGIESEVSATGIKNLLLTLSAGEAATKKQKNALAALGLDAAAMAQAMQKDAPAAILSVLEAVQKLPQAAQAATLTQLFGRESIGAIAPLLTNLTLLRENLAKVGDASQYAGSMGKEYTSRAATTANALQLLKNKGAALAITVGSVLLPQIVAISEKVGGWLEKAVAWAEANPRLAGGLAKLAIAGGAVTAVIGGLLTVGGFAAMMVGQLVKGFALLSGGNGLAGLGATAARFFAPLLGGLKAIGAAVAAFAGSISAPVIAVVAAIAIIAALVWKYWQPIKAFFVGIWDGLMEGLAPVKDAVMFALEPLMPLFSDIGRIISDVIGWIKDFLTPLDASAETLTTVSNAGKAVGYAIGTLLGGAIQFVMLVLNTLFTILKTVFDWSPMGLLVRHWTPITGFFSGLWNSISSLMSGWTMGMMQFGTDLIMGLVNGIRSKIGEAVDAIASVGTRIREFFTGPTQMDINSPSRTFARYGSYIMQGLGIGMEGESATPLAAVRRLGNRLRTAGAGLDMGLGRSADGPLQRIRQLGQQLGKAGAGLALGGTLALPAAALDARAPLAPAGQGSMAQHHSYQIHITVQGNGHAPDIATAVRQEIERIERERRARARARYHDDY